MMRVPPNSTVDSTPDPPSDASRSAWPAKGCDLHHPIRRSRLARDLLHDRHGALAHERDRHRVGAHALAGDAAGGRLKISLKGDCGTIALVVDVAFDG
jgi:hypothetical protein